MFKLFIVLYYEIVDQSILQSPYKYGDSYPPPLVKNARLYPSAW